MKRLCLYILLPLVLIFAGCAEKPWEEMSAKEKAETYVAMNSPEAKKEKWLSLPTEERKALYMHITDSKEMRLIELFEWEEATTFSDHEFEEVKSPF